MVKLIDIILYILKNYPHKNELSNARLTKMIYLIDWRSAFDNGKQITNIKWYFDNYGPFVHDVEEEIVNHPELIHIVETKNIFGKRKKLYRLVDDNVKLSIPTDIENIINTTISVTKGFYWQQFINFIYSTYPIVTSERYTYLNLIEKAKAYKKQIQDETEKSYK